ncbi:MAG: hypothetical protein LBU11_08385 [Zoogloeaceae bacterium]|jgi:hypothetical protein|nr:hypothetical protein [Zoogloeaceae bacterium]
MGKSLDEVQTATIEFGTVWFLICSIVICFYTSVGVTSFEAAFDGYVVVGICWPLLCFVGNKVCFATMLYIFGGPSLVRAKFTFEKLKSRGVIVSSAFVFALGWPMLAWWIRKLIPGIKAETGALWSAVLIHVILAWDIWGKRTAKPVGRQETASPETPAAVPPEHYPLPDVPSPPEPQNAAAPNVNPGQTSSEWRQAEQGEDSDACGKTVATAKAVVPPQRRDADSFAAANTILGNLVPDGAERAAFSSWLYTNHRVFFDLPVVDQRASASRLLDSFRRVTNGNEPGDERFSEIEMERAADAITGLFLEDAEAGAFLGWLADNHPKFLKAPPDKQAAAAGTLLAVFRRTAGRKE